MSTAMVPLENSQSATDNKPPEQRKQKTQHKSLASFVAGGGAGMISTTVLQPLDVIKTHMQAAEIPRNRHFGVVLRGILAEDGVKGLWRGTGPACVRVGLGAGLYFAVLGPMLETIRTGFGGAAADARTSGMLKDKLPAVVTLSAGALTRSLASLVVCPITVIKTRMEVSFFLLLTDGLSKVDVPWMDTFLSAPTSRRVCNTQLLQDD